MAIALTGIGAPIALSFLLRYFASATPLQCFAAGAALCSTSLGTTFTLLRASGLTTTRLGVVLTSAAMMDDVVGLVMAQVISSLGSSGSTFEATTVIRPVFVAIAFIAVLLLLCRFLLQPVTILLNSKRESRPNGTIQRLLRRNEAALLFHTTAMLGLITGASYAGTSNLFAAYLAGAVVSWWDNEVPHPKIDSDAPTTDGTCDGPLVSSQEILNRENVLRGTPDAPERPTKSSVAYPSRT